MRIRDWSVQTCALPIYQETGAMPATPPPFTAPWAASHEAGFLVVPHRAVVQRGGDVLGDHVFLLEVGDGGMQAAEAIEVLEHRLDHLVDHLVVGVRRADESGAHAEHRNVFLKRSEEHTSELQSLMRSSYAASCLKKQKQAKQEAAPT